MAPRAMMLASAMLAWCCTARGQPAFDTAHAKAFAKYQEQMSVLNNMQLSSETKQAADEGEKFLDSMDKAMAKDLKSAEVTTLALPTPCNSASWAVIQATLVPHPQSMPAHHFFVTRRKRRSF